MTISARGLGKTVAGEVHLADIDLELAPGQPHVVIGHTGAGKTTLLRTLAGLDRPTTGSVMIDGVDARQVPVNQRNVGFVYELFVNYPAMTVFENIAAPLRRAGLGRSEIGERVTRTAKLLRIDNLLDRLPGQLSGGQQQRVAIARALAKDAKLLLLDEPLVNLDYKLREELRAELRAIFQNSDTIVVYTTTEPTEALQIGGHTLVMDKGRILQSGRATDVFGRPGSIRVAQIYSDPPINVRSARIGDGWLTIGALRLPVPEHMLGVAEGPCQIGARPSHLSLRAAAGTIGFVGQVDLAEVNGSETYIHAMLDADAWTVHADGVHPVPPGERIEVFLDPSRLYLFSPDGGLLATPFEHGVQ